MCGGIGLEPLLLRELLPTGVTDLKSSAHQRGSTVVDNTLGTFKGNANFMSDTSAVTDVSLSVRLII